MKTESQLKDEIARLNQKIADIKGVNRDLASHIKTQAQSIHFKNQELVRLINYLNSREEMIDRLTLSQTEN